MSRMFSTILLDSLIRRHPSDLLFRLMAGTELGAWRRLRHQYYQKKTKRCSHLSSKSFLLIWIHCGGDCNTGAERGRRSLLRFASFTTCLKTLSENEAQSRADKCPDGLAP